MSFNQKLVHELVQLKVLLIVGVRAAYAGLYGKTHRINCENGLSRADASPVINTALTTH